ncbi:hypothetical protein MKW94_014778 [Papaver nudicaule]|uniref:Chaperone DnaJ C-terminal domain-containing protein n=1 Tax=Papaver nudicaule TaxID=74823 RepID=A0AA41W2U5_PAPNU|nr:hypothetical protein [Papaver nudicaule]
MVHVFRVIRALREACVASWPQDGKKSNGGDEAISAPLFLWVIFSGYKKMFNGRAPEGTSEETLPWCASPEPEGISGGSLLRHSKKLSLCRYVIFSKCTSCSGCQGSGMNLSIREKDHGMVQQQPGDECRGTGETLSNKDRCCPRCKGEKVVKQKKFLEVHVEKGIPNGQIINVSRDIIVIVVLRNHSKFRRIGDDLFVDHHTLSLTEALCGVQFVLAHLDGRKLLIKTKPGEIIKPGSFKAVSNEGMPMYQRPFMKGKLYIHFTSDFHGSLTSEQRKTLKGLLPVRTSSQLNMEFDKCEEVTLLDVSMEEEGRKIQAQYGEDDDMHGRIQCAQQ